MAAQQSQIILTDGTQSFDGGVDSSKVTSLASDLNPNGLQRNENAWMVNAHVRDGGVQCRNGWDYLSVIVDGNSLFQGGIIYDTTAELPYLVALIGGITYRIDLSPPYAVTDLTLGNAALYMPADVEQAYFVQGEEFLIIQAGDYVTLPLFWDGSTLRRSIGITNPTPPISPGINEIPAAGPMEYYMGRIWYARGRVYSAGDIVGGAAGTPAYGFRDSILNVTENPLCAGGDGFTVPSNAGNIRALKYSANIDTALGQGQLFVFTRKQVYSLDVPITRTNWIAATANNQPLQKVVQRVNGAVSDRSIVSVNGDLFYQSLEPAIRSLTVAIRYYEQWGNTPISANENRILQFTDRALQHMCSGIVTDNRLLMSTLPKQTQSGIVSQAIIPLDFDPISSFQKKHPPVWCGHWEGLDFHQLFVADFGGLEKAFGVIRSRVNGTIQLWELTNFQRFDFDTTDDLRITFITETPAYQFSLPYKMKQLVGGELWVDRVFGTVTVNVWYRVDADPCWIFWYSYEFCVSRSTCEDVMNPVCYPETGHSEGYKWPITLPKPPHPCDSMHVRPSDRGYQFQLKIAITGWARLRSVFIYGTEVKRGIYQGLVPGDSVPFRQFAGGGRVPTPPPFPPVPPPALPIVIGGEFNNEIIGGEGSGEMLGEE